MERTAVDRDALCLAVYVPAGSLIARQLADVCDLRTRVQTGQQRLALLHEHYNAIKAAYQREQHAAQPSEEGVCTLVAQLETIQQELSAAEWDLRPLQQLYRNRLEAFEESYCSWRQASARAR